MLARDGGGNAGCSVTPVVRVAWPLGGLDGLLRPFVTAVPANAVVSQFLDFNHRTSTVGRRSP